MATLAERLREGMRINGFRQSDVVQRTGINKGALSSYLSGRYEPKQNNIYLLAKALNVSEAWLMGADVPMERVDTSDQQPQHYYLDDDARDLAQFLFDHPEYKVLFDASRKVKAEDIQFVKDLIDRMAGND